jgi:plastocyanin
MKRPLSVLAVSGLVSALSACGGGGSSAAAPPGTVLVKNISFIPSSITAKVGDTVTWEFKDGATAHNVDGKAALADLYSGNPQSGGSFHYRFSKAGTYRYTCDVHPSMIATVTVS